MRWEGPCAWKENYSKGCIWQIPGWTSQIVVCEMTFESEVAARKTMVINSHPLMGKKVESKKVLIPVEQAIAQIQEAVDCYQGRIDVLRAELKILRDE
jgi:hypothetical protein